LVARKLDQAQLRELSEFVAELKTLGGYTVSAEWARDSGYPAPNLSKLENAVGAIDGYNLLRLIRSSARRADLAPATAALIATPRSAERGGDDPELVVELEELADLLERLQRLGSSIGRRVGGA
jgi:hypothetical protein